MKICNEKHLVTVKCCMLHFYFYLFFKIQQYSTDNLYLFSWKRFTFRKNFNLFWFIVMYMKRHKSNLYDPGYRNCRTLLYFRFICFSFIWYQINSPFPVVILVYPNFLFSFMCANEKCNPRVSKVNLQFDDRFSFLNLN